MVFRLRQILGAGTLCLSVMAIALATVGWHVTTASALASASASAVVAEFGGEGEGSGDLSEPRGLAVDQESGDVYVVDRNNERVDKFTAEGEFLLTWGWAVQDGASQLESCAALCLGGEQGAGAGQLHAPQGVAVDESGLVHDVYVVDASNARVEKYSPTGEFLLMFGKSVNATTGEDVCVAGESCQAGAPGSESGAFAFSNGSQYIGVGPSGTVYVGDDERIQQFDTAGKLLGEVALPGAGEVTALALSPAGGIYVEATGLSGVHEYEDCAGVCTGVELGEPRDQTGVPLGSSDTIAVGSAGELFVDDAASEHHILEYGPTGEQVASFDATGVTAASGLAYGATIERLYALHESKVRLLPIPVPGPLILPGSVIASEVLATTAMVTARVNPEGGVGASYHFEYGTTEAYGESTPEESLSGGDFEDQVASAQLSALAPGSVYHFRAVVTNAAHETTFGSDQTFTTLAPVPIDSESTSQVTASSARLSVELNPLGNATEYHFEYGTSQAYGSNVPEPDASAGSAKGDVTETVLLEGLAPETIYHYRVVAHSVLGVTVGADATFTTQGATMSLADGRAWELVSPPEKHGVSFESLAQEGGVIQAASSGRAVTYFAKGPIDTEPAGNRSIANSQLLSSRTGDSWATEDISTPHEQIAGIVAGNLSEYRVFSSELTTALVQPEGSTPLSEVQGANAERTPYIREANGKFKALVTSENVPPGTEFLGEEPQPQIFVGGVLALTATPDLRDVILASPQDLDTTHAFESQGNQSLYEWFNGASHLVSVLPSETPAAEAGLISELGFKGKSVRGALSSDGSRVFFEAGPPRHLYVRDVDRGETVQIDVPDPGVAAGSGQPAFQVASEDGRVVYFTDEQRLTVDARATSNQPELYTCNVEVIVGHLKCTGLKDVSVSIGSSESGQVLGEVVASDESGADAYFVANGRLSAGAEAGDCEQGVFLAPVLPKASQKCGLYRYDVNTGVSLVGMLSNRDAPEWEGSQSAADQGTLTFRESANGRFLTFMSQAPLTGYDNRDARTGERDEEVFLYDTESESLTCVSCARSGARPSGVVDPPDFPGLLVDREKIWENQSLAGSIPGWTRVDEAHALYASRVLSNSGRLFFNSADALVPQDTNGKEDVYEYEPDGIGTCSDVTGCVSLMSGGKSSEETAFLDASEGGNDVFFLTASQLTGSDTDQAFDVYDAHVCTAAAPCPSGTAPVSVPPCASADSCRATAPAPPAVTLSTEASYGGSGNLAVTRAVVTRTRPLTRVQKLAKAMKQCKKKKRRKLRVSCERSAQRAFGRTSKVKSSSKAKRSAR
jgi:hypothetical protein